MKTLTSFRLVAGCFAFLIYLVSAHTLWAQAKGHASVGLGHGEEGYLHLEEMIKHLEFSLNTPNADEQLKAHNPQALQHAREALRHYDAALRHVSEALGRPAKHAIMEGSGGNGSSSRHEYREEGSH
ncbi:MAG: hypothetical protein VYC17_01905 [Nitrospinota bacterium]|nr:hypothetical protein [Nitrospinota bacterium]